MQPVTERPLVAGADLEMCAGKEVLVSSSPDPHATAPASGWQWCVILDVNPHAAGPAWRSVQTDRGERTVTAAGWYSIRDPRPASPEGSDG
jgi:hypothetical protein